MILSNLFGCFSTKELSLVKSESVEERQSESVEEKQSVVEEKQSVVVEERQSIVAEERQSVVIEERQNVVEERQNVGNDDEKRIIDINSINCTNEIINDAQKTQICGPNPFQLLNTEVCEDLRFTYYALKKPILLPNPVKDILNIEFFIPQSEKGIIQIYNSIGQLIAEPINGLLQQGKNTVQLDILNSNYGNGLFFVKFIAMNKSFVSKLIIDK